MKGHKTRGATPTSSGGGVHKKSSEHPLVALQGTAGNRAVASLVHMHLQRQKKGAAGQESSGPPGPSAALLSWFDASILAPIGKAIASKKSGVAVKELQNAKHG